MIGKSPDAKSAGFFVYGLYGRFELSREPIIVSIMPKSEPNEERNAAIVKLRQAGASFAEIGRQHGLSAQRARQIFMRKEQDRKLRDGPFKALGLSDKLLNALFKAGFETIEQVAKTSDEEMLKLPNIGKVGLLEIRKALANWKSTRVDPARVPLPSGRGSLVADRHAQPEDN